MVRPKASPALLEAAVTMARSVTVESKIKTDFVARIGCYSLFSFITRISPKVHKYFAFHVVKLRHDSNQACRTKDATGSDRNGISHTEFNKALQAGGWIRIRARHANMMRYILYVSKVRLTP